MTNVYLCIALIILWHNKAIYKSCRHFLDWQKYLYYFALCFYHMFSSMLDFNDYVTCVC